MLHEISAKAFKGLERNLEMLDLSANRLKDLPDTLLDDFDLIKEVILSENMLSLLPNVSFNGFRYSIKELYLLGEDMNYVPLNQACPCFSTSANIQLWAYENQQSSMHEVKRFFHEDMKHADHTTTT